jgi:hypothetical protein
VGVGATWCVLCRRKRPSNGSPTTSPTASANGPEAVLGGSRALVVHEEGAAVGDEGGVGVAFLLVLLMLPSPALAQRLLPPRSACSRRAVGLGSARLQVERLGVVGAVCKLQAAQHQLRVLGDGQGGVGASNGRRGLAAGRQVGAWSCVERPMCFPLDLAVCERGCAVDVAQVAVVCIAVLVDIAGHRHVALGIVGQRGHGLALVFVVEPPAACNVVCPLAYDGGHGGGGACREATARARWLRRGVDGSARGQRRRRRRRRRRRLGLRDRSGDKGRQRGDGGRVGPGGCKRRAAVMGRWRRVRIRAGMATMGNA